MSEEIRIRPFIAPLIQRWYLIAGAGLLGLGIGIGLILLLTETYEATTAVAIVRSRTDVNFDSRIVELTGTELSNNDTEARRQALISLVKSNDIALAVLEENEIDIAPIKRSAPELLEIIEAANDGDLILISVQHPHPETAARLANAWAYHYENLINNLFGTSTSTNIDILEAQVAEAADTYKETQTNLEIFISNNQIVSLQNEITSQEMLKAAFQEARNAVQIEPVNLQIATQKTILADQYEILQQIEQWLADALALQDQISAGSGSTSAELGNALAIIGLRSRIFGGLPPVELQISLAEDDIGPVRATDVEAIIAVLETRRAVTIEKIEEISIELSENTPTERQIAANHPLNNRINELNRSIQSLQARLAAQEAEERELVQARDLAWEAYQTLQRKQTEEQIAIQTIGREVRVAVTAVPPIEPDYPPRFIIIILSVAIGISLSIFAIFAHEWNKQNPITSREENHLKK